MQVSLLEDNGVPKQHIHGRIGPLESHDNITNMSNRIQDMTFFTVFLVDDSGIKSCNLFMLFQYGRAPIDRPPRNYRSSASRSVMNLEA